MPKPVLKKQKLFVFVNLNNQFNGDGVGVFLLTSMHLRRAYFCDTVLGLKRCHQ